MPGSLRFGPEPFDSDTARAITRDYLAEVAGRHHGRPLDERELDGVVLEFPNDDLRAPTGLLLLATLDGRPAGCAGLRIGQDATGEIVRVFVRGQHRRRGVAKALMTELETVARAHVLHTLRLDTRHDLTEARRLYAALGYDEVAPFNDEPYAEHWFERRLIDPGEPSLPPVDSPPRPPWS